MSKKAKEPDAGAARSVPGKHLTTRQWAEAETLYMFGDITISEIAKKHGLSPQSVSQHMTRFGIKKDSKKAEHAKKIAESIGTALIGDAGVLAARIRETKEDHYKMASGLAKLTWAEVLKTKQDGVPISVAMGNLRALDAAMSVLKKAREERYAVLGLDRADFVDEEGLPELVISELTPEQIISLQQRDVDFDDLQANDGDEADVIDTADMDETSE